MSSKDHYGPFEDILRTFFLELVWENLLAASQGCPTQRVAVRVSHGGIEDSACAIWNTGNFLG